MTVNNRQTTRNKPLLGTIIIHTYYVTQILHLYQPLVVALYIKSVSWWTFALFNEESNLPFVRRVSASPTTSLDLYARFMQRWVRINLFVSTKRYIHTGNNEGDDNINETTMACLCIQLSSTGRSLCYLSSYPLFVCLVVHLFCYSTVSSSDNNYLFVLITYFHLCRSCLFVPTVVVVPLYDLDDDDGLEGCVVVVALCTHADEFVRANTIHEYSSVWADVCADDATN